MEADKNTKASFNSSQQPIRSTQLPWISLDYLQNAQRNQYDVVITNSNSKLTNAIPTSKSSSAHNKEDFLENWIIF